MRQSIKISLAAVALLGGTILATAAASRPQDKGEAKGQPKSETKAPGGMDPAMMNKMFELATPGEEHKELAKRVGTWEQHFKMRMSPDQPWMEFDGKSEIKALLDGRYIQEDASFEMMGMPMHGMNILGYDKMSQEYISLWADSMSTWWVTARGKKDASGTVELKGTMVDVAGPRPYRMVIRAKGDDAIESEMYDTIPPKGDVLVMTITSTRKK